MTGYGPIEPLLKDPTITDILINTHKRCFVERFGQLQETKIHFKDEAHLLRIINKIVAGIGRRVDESSPLVDARLPDGSRVNVAVRPIAVDGPLVSIRKFSEKPFNHGSPDRHRRACARLWPKCLPRRSRARFRLDHHRRHRQRQDHVAQRAVALHP